MTQTSGPSIYGYTGQTSVELTLETLNHNRECPWCQTYGPFALPYFTSIEDRKESPTILAGRQDYLGLMGLYYYQRAMDLDQPELK